MHSSIFKIETDGGYNPEKWVVGNIIMYWTSVLSKKSSQRPGRWDNITHGFNFSSELCRNMDIKLQLFV